MRVYAKLHRFETVFESDPYIEVGADGNDKETLMAQRLSAAMYEKQLLAWVFLSQALQSNVDKATFTAVRPPGNVGSWCKIGTTLKPTPKRDCA